MTEVKPMETAPHDGRRILLHYYVKLYNGETWYRSTTKWEECHWVDNHWQPWEGKNINSTHHIYPKDTIAWMEAPKVVTNDPSF